MPKIPQACGCKNRFACFEFCTRECKTRFRRGRRFGRRRFVPIGVLCLLYVAKAKETAPRAIIAPLHRLLMGLVDGCSSIPRTQFSLPRSQLLMLRTQAMRVAMPAASHTPRFCQTLSPQPRHRYQTHPTRPWSHRYHTLFAHMGKQPQKGRYVSLIYAFLVGAAGVTSTVLARALSFTGAHIADHPRTCKTFCV